MKFFTVTSNRHKRLGNNMKRVHVWMDVNLLRMIDEQCGIEYPERNTAYPRDNARDLWFRRAVFNELARRNPGVRYAGNAGQKSAFDIALIEKCRDQEGMGPEHRRTLERTAELRHSGMSIADICKRLDAEGIRTPAGLKWSRANLFLWIGRNRKDKKRDDGRRRIKK